MHLPPERKNLFRDTPDPIITPFRVIALLIILTGISVLFSISQGDIEKITLITPTATRNAYSYSLEGKAWYEAGDMAKAVLRYEEALALDPENVLALLELSQLQVYYAALLTSQDAEVILAEARQNIDLAAELDNFNSDVHAMRTLVYDWSASYVDTSTEDGVALREEYLAIASQSAVRAVQLDAENALAYTYRAEVLSDQLSFTQANDLIEIALELDPNSMDVHRVFANILESQGFYSRAIEEYKKAVEFAPNFTYLHIRIGVNYRQLKLYDQALAYFAQAATINETLDIQDPVPFIAIAKTYMRQGEFFIAARNAETALGLDPTNANLYGELGIIRFRARNYEGSLLVLKCATVGCTDGENEDGGVAVTGLTLNNVSVVFYYTYGSVLAALDQCDAARPVLLEVQQVYAADEIISGIVQESLFVCEQLEGGGAVSTSTPPPTEEMDMEDGGG